MKAGEWLGLAETVEELQKSLAGSVLAPHWPQSLEFLRRDCLEEAGVVGEREVEAFLEEHPVRRVA